MTLTVGTKLGPYEILAPIGAGGMGEVWKARDSRLGRIVAIKQVKEQHSERFKQEARSIAALNHQYICQLFDIGPDYLVLEYVEGKSLPCPLPEREAVRLAIQIAAALEAAHRKGIIHRDLKPANIMLTDEGSVKLLDFGLAKLYEQDASSSSSPTADFPATQAGAVLGTVAYMSPEQAQGQPADARSDIFSFGLVLYEMLSGRRAFSGGSPHVTMAALLRDEPPSLQASPSLEKILRRCLAKQPSARYQTMTEIRAALEQVFGERVPGSFAASQPSIAVLPFVNMSGDKEQEYFSDGLAEEIINALTQIPGLKVTARTSSFFFRGREADVREIGTRLNVGSILEGSVRKAGNRIRIAAQLINVADGYHIWSDRFDRDMTDVFAIQDEISEAIAEKLRVRLSGDRPLIRRYTENLEAYNLYLKGRYQLLRLTPEGLMKGREHFEQAVALAQDYALAWFGLAEFYRIMGFFGYMLPKTANEQCRQAALKALELDERLPEAHAEMGALRASEFDWKGAEQEFRRALELNPKSEEVWAIYVVYYLSPMGNLDEAVEGSLRVLERDPLSPYLQWLLGAAYYQTRQWNRAIEQFNNALELNPQYVAAYYQLGISYFELGKVDEAIRTIEKGLQIEGHNPISLSVLGMYYALAGRIGEAQHILGQLQDLAKSAYVSSLAFAYVYLGLGEIDKAFDWFEKAVDERVSMVFLIPVSSLFDPLRSHPRYHALMRKMNLEA